MSEGRSGWLLIPTKFRWVLSDPAVEQLKLARSSAVIELKASFS
jgi:hypothetical protein